MHINTPNSCRRCKTVCHSAQAGRHPPFSLVRFVCGGILIGTGGHMALSSLSHSTGPFLCCFYAVAALIVLGVQRHWMLRFHWGEGGIWVYGQMVCIYMSAWALSFIFSRTLYPGTKTRGEILFKLSLVLILWPITLSVNEEVTQFKRSHSILFLGLVFLLWTPVNQELYRPPENSIYAATCLQLSTKTPSFLRVE